MIKQPDTAVILVNLGTPDAPEKSSVGRFLREFLSDRRVVELPRIPWWLLLNGVVIPRRSKRVAEMYRNIWLDSGSPIRVYTEALAGKLKAELAANSDGGLPAISVAMTYGSPGIADTISECRSLGIEKFLVIPMYPQYSATTTGPVFDQVCQYMMSCRNVPIVKVQKQYYEREEYIGALADSVRESWQRNGKGKKLLISFHGIPKKYIDAGDPYYRQCQKTAESVARKLDLTNEDWDMSFQSRFGASEWAKPYTQEVLQNWPGQGIDDVSVISPAFSVDCLETLYEIDVELRHVFLEAGGRNYQYIPCLNDGISQVKLFTSIIKESLSSL